ncbi:MAG: 1-acyl-sn-glycerol-3-phosphate acyltransferase [Acidimicrobiia bacterium]|nr:lysophospholipid acyltransferase family protein [bacterium]MDE0642815.1 lysophospholipid acyltransferase family protein [bacterium]MXX64826.1 1-acyl-sn-glycerol-3-phosphate acyltransferase [Acidimicrobiia bacterium]
MVTLLVNGLRTGLVFAVAVPVTVLCALAIILHTMVRPTGPILEWIPRFWGRMWCVTAGAKLTIEGLENIDRRRAYVVVSNHQSSFDIFVHFAVMPVPIRFLAKTELYKIPLFGTAMRKFGIVEVDRAAGRAAHQAVNQGAAETTRLGRSLMIYPEGTRSRDGTMLPFKKGAFYIARNLGLPVLPVAITGTRAIWEPGSKLIRSGPIKVAVMAPIPTEGLNLKDIDDLRNQAFSRIVGVVEAEPD